MLYIPFKNVLHSQLKLTFFFGYPYEVIDPSEIQFFH